MSRPIPPELSERLALIDADPSGYRGGARRKRDSLAVVLTLSYVEAAALMLLGTAWLGMTAAARIAMPIGALAGAARAVRDGDLSVRMLRPTVRDEIADLADAFNEMTDRLARQTTALDRGQDRRGDALGLHRGGAGGRGSGRHPGGQQPQGDHRQCIGAERCWVSSQRPAARRRLGQIAPEFVAAARRAIETGQSVDTSFKRADRERHAAPAGAGGAGAWRRQARSSPSTTRRGL